MLSISQMRNYENQHVVYDPSYSYLPSAKKNFEKNDRQYDWSFQDKWVKKLCEYPPHEKKIWLLRSIKQLKNDQSLSLSELLKYQCNLEAIAFSTQVSNLRQYYHDEPWEVINRGITLDSLYDYLKSKYPLENIWRVKGEFNDRDLEDLCKINNKVSIVPSFENFDQYLRLKTPIYILYQYYDNCHKMLMVFHFREDGKPVLNVFDSLGVNTAVKMHKNDMFHEILKSIYKKFFSIFPNFKYNDVHTMRQKDRSNCALFVIKDLKEARKLLNQNQSLFLYNFGPPNAFFLKISQNENDDIYVKEKYIRPMNVSDSPEDLDIAKAFLNTKKKYDKCLKRTDLNANSTERDQNIQSFREAIILKRDHELKYAQSKQVKLVNVKALILSLKLLKYHIKTKAKFEERCEND